MFKSLRSFYLALVALIGLCGAVAVGNYTMTQGSGTSFGSVVVGGTVHYAQQLICDLTTPAQCASVSAGGAVKVDNSAVTQPVSGTVTSNVGTGTRPVSVASGQVASGAYASGSIGAGAQVDLLTMRQTVANGTAASNSLLVGGVYNSSPLTLTNTQGAALQFDVNGYLKVNTAAGAAAGGTSSNFGSAFPTPGTAVGFTDGTNMVAARVGAVANSTAATNYINSLGVCQYLASAPTITDTRFNQIQCDTNGYLRVTVQNTNSNLTPGDAIATGTYTVGSPTLGGTLLFNGTSYDRLRSGTTTGSALINGAGTAGTAAGGVVTVQGVASMTPILANPGTAANWAVGATASAVPANAHYMGFNSGGNLTGPSLSTPLPVRQTDGTNPTVTDPCAAVTKTNVTGSQTAGAQIIAGTSAKKTYICSITLIAGAAEIVNIIAGTGTVCATGSSAVMGSTTAANGMSFAANGGMTLGNGAATVIAATAANADNVCLTQSGSSRVTYQLTYVQL